MTKLTLKELGNSTAPYYHHYKNYLLIILLIVYSLVGCRKSIHSSSSKLSYYLPQDGLLYIQLDVGRRFIYRDSASSALDSVVVTKSLIERYTGPSIFGGTYAGERYTLILSRIDPTGTLSEWLNGVADSYTSSDFMAMIPADHSGAYLFRYPPRTSSSEGSIASMQVEGNTYSDIIYTKDNSALTYSYYWAKGVGLIKYSRTDRSGTKAYTLVRRY